jgi:hypothetical protein
MSDYCVKISAKSDHHALQNLSSNTDAKFARIDNNLRIYLGWIFQTNYRKIFFMS